MPDEAAERSQQPTPRKLQRARQKGRIPRSKELGSVSALVALLVSIAFLAPFMVNRMSQILTEGLMANTGALGSEEAFVAFFREVLVQVMVLTVPTMAVLMVATVGGTVLFGGFVFSAETIKLRWDALNPASNLKNAMNAQAIATLVLSILKVALVSLIIWWYLRDRLDSLVLLRWASPGEILSQIGKLVLGMCIRVVVALLFVALADMLFQHWKYMKDMRMSFQEIKQENKETEGSPEVRSRIRSIRYQMLQEQMRQAVPQADVVLVNPTHYAVALKYDPDTMPAPMLLAKGVDHKAAVIREVARAYGVPVMRRPELTRTIYGTVDVGKPVPEGLYMAVAEVLAVIYQLRQQKAKR